MSEKTSSTWTSTKGRASFVSVLRARMNDLSGKEEYSMVFLLPKSEKESVAAARKAIAAALASKFNPAPPKWRNPLKDGDNDTKENGEPFGPECQGHFVLNVKTTQKPPVVDRTGNDIIDPQDFQSGDYCRIAVNFSAYDQKGNRGVGAYLNAVQVVAKGEPLGSRIDAKKHFGTWTDDEDGVV